MFEGIWWHFLFLIKLNYEKECIELMTLAMKIQGVQVYRYDNVL